MTRKTVFRAGVAVAVAAAGMVVAPAAHASNNVNFVLGSTTWPHDVKLDMYYDDAFKYPKGVDHPEDLTSSEKDSIISPDSDGSLKATVFAEHTFFTDTLSNVHQSHPQVGARLTGKKYDLDGTAHQVSCSVVVENNTWTPVSADVKSDCADSGVSAELTSGLGLGFFSAYTLTFTFDGKPTLAPVRIQSAEAARGAALTRDDCIIGTDGDDMLTGTPGDDCIIGGKGDDTIDGGGGNDIILAGPGDDTITGGDGDDKIFAGSGDDSIDPGDGTDFVHGATGDDTVASGDGDGDPDTVVDSQTDVSPQAESTDSGDTQEVDSSDATE